MGTDPIRALCAEMAAELDSYYIGMRGNDRSPPLAREARTALSEPADGPAAVAGELSPPPEGEVAELANSLRHSGDALRVYGLHAGADTCTRAADLLQRQAAPVPVPVAERLPEPEDCDAEGRCWLLGKVEREWRLLSATNSGLPHLRYGFSHWLPSHALPLPAQAGEVQPDD